MRVVISGTWKMARYCSAWLAAWKMPWVVTWAMTLLSTTGVNERMEKSWRITSRVNRTPPKGALKIALMPAAVPHPVRTGMWLRATRNTSPTPDAMAAPIWTIGPSAPALPPLPIVRALVSVFSMAMAGRWNPLVRTTDSITSTTPWPSRARKTYRLTTPTASPPAAGRATSSHRPHRWPYR